MTRRLPALLLALVLGLTGCASSEPSSAPEPPAAAAPAEEPSSRPEESSSQPEEPASETDATPEVDLTGMSSTMVFAEVYNMMVEPERYEGKTVRMTGELVTYPHPFTGEDCLAVIVKDALACCAQGFQFQPAQGTALPEAGTEVTVTGIYTLDNSLADQGIMMSYLAQCTVE